MKSSILLFAGGVVVLVIIISVSYINRPTGNTATNGANPRPAPQPSTTVSQTSDADRAGQEALRGMYNHKQANNKIDNVFANERGDEATTKP